MHFAIQACFLDRKQSVPSPSSSISHNNQNTQQSKAKIKIISPSTHNMKLSCFSISVIANVAFLIGTVHAAEEVCEDGDFNPDPTKYYTLYNPTWSYDLDGPGYLRQKNTGVNTCTQNEDVMVDKTNNAKQMASAHWRFVYESDTDQWSLVNRLSGLSLSEHSWPSEVTKVKMFSNRGKFNCPCRADNTRIRLSVICAPSPSSYGWSDMLWQVEEVTVFQKVTSSGVTVKDQGSALYSLADGLAWGGTVAYEAVAHIAGNTAGWWLSGAVAIAWSLGATYITGSTEDDGIADQLQDLADDILDVTSSMIDSAIASNGVNEFSNAVDLYRSYFTGSYVTNKHYYIERVQTATTISDFEDYEEELEDLADALKAKADNYYDDIYTFFNSDFDYTTNINIAKADIGFDLLKYSIVEALTMAQEALLLDSYVEVGETCETLIELHSLEDYKNTLEGLLQDTYDMLYEWRTYECCDIRKRNGKFDMWHGDQKLINNMNNRDNVQSIRTTYKAELRHEVEHLLYVFDTQMDFLDNFLTRTIEACEGVRTDSQFRTNFLTDGENSTFVCRVGDETCVDDIDCCSNICSDNVCDEIL